MTERFKEAVKAYVSDCVLTEQEKSELLRIAKEDGINESDAIIYMNSELKKKKNKRKRASDVGEVLKEVGKVTVSIIGFAGAILGGIAAINNAKTEREKLKNKS